jgi:ribosomal protein L30E
MFNFFKQKKTSIPGYMDYGSGTRQITKSKPKNVILNVNNQESLQKELDLLNITDIISILPYKTDYIDSGKIQQLMSVIVFYK